MAKPKLALIPAAQGDKFYSVLPSDGVGDFDFTRNSSATRIAPTGFIQTVESYGSELVTNGNFDGNANNWSFGSSYAYGNNNIIATSSNSDLSQNSVYGANGQYKISLDITQYSAGALRAIDYSGTTLGNFNISGIGTFSIIVNFSNSNKTFYLRASSSLSATIDNISVKKEIGNISRLNYDLLNGKVVNCPHYLLEPASTNLVTYSEAFSNSYWAKTRASITSNSIISPDGTLNASKLIEDTANGSHFLLVNPVYTTSSANNVVSLSLFAKKSERDLQIQSFASGGGENPKVNFDLTNGTATSVGLGATPTFSIQSFGNDWFRCTLTYTVSQSGSGVRFYISMVNNNATSYQGDGSSGFYIYGAQLEVSSYPTSYIPTNGTAITRAAETATGSGDAATFNDSKGVLMAEISALADDFANYKFISLYDGTYNNFCDIYYGDASNRISVRFRSGAGSIINMFSVLVDIKVFNKIAISWKLNEFKFFINGLRIGINPSGSAPTGLNKLDFSQVSNANPFYGKTRELQYFDSSLTDAQLETLTSWTSLQEMITSQLYTNY